MTSIEKKVGEKKRPDPYKFYPHDKLEDLPKDDYYAILGLEGDREFSTPTQIKKAYHKLSLEYHPDKNPDNQARYTLINTAYEILSKDETRRNYDSWQYFDDTIPGDLMPRDDFYDTFGDVFDANSKWSTVQPVPELGDADTPYEQVQEFYAFWRDFKSWRVFNYLDEYTRDDFEEAEDREERRWMQRRNENDRKRNKRTDNARIRELVETAYRNDPRIWAYKQAQEQERQRIAEEKRIEDERIRAEKARLVAEQEAKALEEKKEGPSAADREKAKLKRTLMGIQRYADSEKVDRFVENLKRGQIKKLQNHLRAEEYYMIHKMDNQRIFPQ